MDKEKPLIELGPVDNFDHKVLIVGNGLIGNRLASDFGDRATVVDIPQIDITHPYQMLDLVSSHKDKDIIIDAAGRTDVDGAQAESALGENGPTYRVNVIGNKNMTAACLEFNKYYVSFSSETGFGNGRPKHGILESEIPPVYLSREVRGVYAGTKAKGEFPVLGYFIHGGRGIILRISYPSDRGKGYIAKVVNFPKLYDDCDITPTLIPELAQVITRAHRLKITGCVLHPVGTATSPYKFGMMARKSLGIPGKAVRARFENTAGKAPRPQYGALSREKTQQLLGVRLRTSKEQIRYLTSR